MIRPKVYLDTSVVSHLLADDVPIEQRDTHKLWEQLKQGEYEVIVSPVVFEELSKCDDDLERRLVDYLGELDTMYVDETGETLALAKAYLDTGIMRARTRDDCRHIAIASVAGCKYILSWNMKHFVKRRTIEMVQDVNRSLGIFQPGILTPTIFIEGDDEGE